MPHPHPHPHCALKPLKLGPGYTTPLCRALASTCPCPCIHGHSLWPVPSAPNSYMTRLLFSNPLSKRSVVYRSLHIGILLQESGSGRNTDPRLHLLHFQAHLHFARCKHAHFVQRVLLPCVHHDHGVTLGHLRPQMESCYEVEEELLSS